MESELVDICFSDHRLIFCCYQSSTKSEKNKPIVIRYKVFKEENLRDFAGALNDTKYSLLFGSDDRDIDQSSQNFLNHVSRQSDPTSLRKRKPSKIKIVNGSLLKYDGSLIY